MKHIINQAIRRLETQGMTPLSPCAIDPDGGLRMCTAAAVAAAGLEQRFGTEASKEFERQLHRRRGPEPLYEAFARLALPRSLCEAMKIYNDSAAAPHRRESVVDFLTKLPTLA